MPGVVCDELAACRYDERMTDPNPYEPPRESELVTTAKVIKRGIGVGLILLLTPIAVLVAFGASCALTIAVVDSPLFGQNYGLVFVVGWSIFLLPPMIVLAGMIWWAIRASTMRRGN
jgi:hypothetical protein